MIIMLLLIFTEKRYFMKVNDLKVFKHFSFFSSVHKIIEIWERIF